MKWWHQQYVIMFCKMSSSGPSNVHLGGFPESCGGFVALRCCRVEQTLLNSGEQLWCEIGHVDALKAPKEQQKVVTFKCSHRARFTWWKWAVSAGTKRGTLHFVINAANCVSTFPARGQLRAVSLCVNRPQKFTSPSLEGRRCDGQQLAGWQINKAAL